METIQTTKPYNPVRPKFKRPKMLTGLTFGRLTAIAFWSVYQQASHWLCRCSCGKWTVASANKLTQGHSASCGCLIRDLCIARSTKHGEGTRKNKTAEYQVYKGLRKRCNNPNCKDYPDYGGRGIECRYTSFQEFLADVGRRPTVKHKIDRIDNDGHYEVGNVKWSTDTESANNKRNNHRLTYNGVTKTIPDWARSMDMTITALRHRIKRGWSVEKALTYPVRKS